MVRLLVCLAAFMLVASGCAATSATLDAPSVDDGALDRVGAVPAPLPEGLALADDIQPATLVPTVPSELRLAVMGDVVTDPVAASPVRPTDMIVVDLLFDGLTVWDEHIDRWRPHIGSSFDVDEDGLTWTVGIDPDATFSDGRPIDAEAVAASFERVLAAPSTLAAARLDAVVGVSAVDDATVVFDLASPLAHLPLLLSSPVYGIVPDDAATGAIGSGPMVMAGARQLRMVDPGAMLTGVRLVGVDDDVDAARALGRGEIDLAYVSSSFAGPVDAARPSVVETHLVFHVNAEGLDDVEVRRRIIGAIDREALADAAFGAGALPVGGLLETDTCELCGGAGTDLTGVGPIEVRYVDDAAGREARLATELVDQLTVAGAEAVAVASDLDTFLGVVAVGGHDVVRSGWVGLVPWPDSRLAPFVSSSPENLSGYENSAVDDAVAAARLTGEADDYAAAAALVDDDAVVLPVARLQVRVLLGPDVDGLLLHHDGTFAVDGLSVRR